VDRLFVPYAFGGGDREWNDVFDHTRLRIHLKIDTTHR